MLSLLSWLPPTSSAPRMPNRITPLLREGSNRLARMMSSSSLGPKENSLAPRLPSRWQYSGFSASPLQPTSSGLKRAPPRVAGGTTRPRSTERSCSNQFSSASGAMRRRRSPRVANGSGIASGSGIGPGGGSGSAGVSDSGMSGMGIAAWGAGGGTTGTGAGAGSGSGASDISGATISDGAGSGATGGIPSAAGADSSPGAAASTSATGAVIALAGCTPRWNRAASSSRRLSRPATLCPCQRRFMARSSAGIWWKALLRMCARMLRNSSKRGPALEKEAARL